MRSRAKEIKNRLKTTNLVRKKTIKVSNKLQKKICDMYEYLLKSQACNNMKNDLIFIL